LVKYLSLPFYANQAVKVKEMTDFKQMHDETMEYLRSRGFTGLVDSICDYKNGLVKPLEPMTTPTQKTKSVNTTSKNENKNERPHVGTVGPSSPIEVVN
jgi:hypothetical protein